MCPSLYLSLCLSAYTPRITRTTFNPCCSTNNLIFTTCCGCTVHRRQLYPYMYTESLCNGQTDRQNGQVSTIQPAQCYRTTEGVHTDHHHRADTWQTQGISTDPNRDSVTHSFKHSCNNEEQKNLLLHQSFSLLGVCRKSWLCSSGSTFQILTKRLH